MLLTFRVYVIVIVSHKRGGRQETGKIHKLCAAEGKCVCVCGAFLLIHCKSTSVCSWLSYGDETNKSDSYTVWPALEWKLWFQ